MKPSAHVFHSKLAVFCFAVVAAFLVFWTYAARKSERVSRTADIVQVAAARMCKLEPPPARNAMQALQNILDELQKASVIRMNRDGNGQFVDPFGSAFRVEMSRSDSHVVVTVTSAGPDLNFGTADDITAVERK